MGYKDTDKCIEKAYKDERLFVLMARDPSAPIVIGEWIKQNLLLQPREKLIEAIDCAIEMGKRQQEFSDRKNGLIRCQHPNCQMTCTTATPWCNDIEVCPGVKEHHT